MTHLAARTRFRLAIEMQAGARFDNRSRQRKMSSPIRLCISTGPCARALPSGKPQMARKCCSNCDVTAPSSVQWPELWTRGAISLTSRRRPRRSLDHETFPPPARRHSRARRRFSAPCRRPARSGRGRYRRERRWWRGYVARGCCRRYPRRRNRRRDRAPRPPRLRRRKGRNLPGWRAGRRASGRPPQCPSLRGSATGPCHHSRSAASSGSKAVRSAPRRAPARRRSSTCA